MTRGELENLLDRIYPPSLCRFIASLSSYNPSFRESVMTWLRESVSPPSPLERLKELFSGKKPGDNPSLQDEVKGILSSVEETDLYEEGSERKYLQALIRGLGKIKGDREKADAMFVSSLDSFSARLAEIGPGYHDDLMWALIGLWEKGKTGVFADTVEDYIVSRCSDGGGRSKILRYTLKTKDRTGEEISRLQHLRGRLKESGGKEKPEDRIKRARECFAKGKGEAAVKLLDTGIREYGRTPSEILLRAEKLSMLRKMGWKEKEEEELLEELEELDEGKLERLKELTDAEGRWERTRDVLLSRYSAYDRLRFYVWEKDKALIMRYLTGLRSLELTEKYIRMTLPEEEKQAAALVVRVIMDNVSREDWRKNRELSRFLSEMRALMPGEEDIFSEFLDRLSRMGPAVRKEFSNA